MRITRVSVYSVDLPGQAVGRLVSDLLGGARGGSTWRPRRRGRVSACRAHRSAPAAIFPTRFLRIPFQ